MNRLQLSLFGRFVVQWDGQRLHCLDGQKVQELVCYLLIHHDRCHFRERLAELLWENSNSSQSRQYLRRALWQLQSNLDAELDAPLELIDVDAEWLQINPDSDYWCDVTQFEEAFKVAERQKGQDLTLEQAQALEAATDLYHGDLLESWYQEWCLLERERFQNMHLIMLDKLMRYCEASRQYERGISFGERILRCDIARERTYRRLIRLSYLAGDRTGALRYYARCEEMLHRELTVRPGKLTVALYEQIKTDQAPSPAPSPTRRPVSASATSPSDLLYRLEAVQQEIENIKIALASRL